MKQHKFLFLFLIFFILMFLKVCTTIIEKFVGSPLNHPTKCFSCEAQYPPQYAWMGQNTKCFSCEQDMLQRTGRPDAVFNSHPIKYYSS